MEPETEQSDFITKSIINSIINSITETITTNSITTNSITELTKKRVSVEHNGMELVIAILFTNITIHTTNELLEKINDEQIYSKIEFNTIDDLKKYKDDTLKKIHILNDYIKYFRETMIYQDLHSDNIKRVFISGKKNKHQKIKILNNNIDKKAAKADIYIELENDKIIGISVKQSKDAPLSNYSVHNLLDKDIAKGLTREKKNYLKENGFTSFIKTQRNNINKLFYPKNKTNPYWEKLKEQISLNKQKIVQQVIESLFCSNVSYDIYEFNGVSFTKLNKNIDLDNVNFEEYLPYYFTKSGEERQTAKLFYKLTIDEKIFRVEVIWKGNVYNASPQFLICYDE